MSLINNIQELCGPVIINIFQWDEHTFWCDYRWLSLYVRWGCFSEPKFRKITRLLRKYFESSHVNEINSRSDILALLFSSFLFSFLHISWNKQCLEKTVQINLKPPRNLQKLLTLLLLLSISPASSISLSLSLAKIDFMRL